MAQTIVERSGQQQTGDDLRSFLKTLRKRIDPGTKTLGSYERLANKLGRAVSQEELAEAIGVSRGWYALLESGASVQPSTALLTRLADALKVSASERVTLFRLAIPALQHGIAPVPDDIKGLSLLRAASSRLRSAESDKDALVIAAECAAHWFDDALLIVSAKRMEDDSWDWSIGLNSGIHPEQQFAPHLADLPYIQERIDTPNGFHGFIHVRHAIGHVYSQFDREVLAAIADIASLALS